MLLNISLKDFIPRGKMIDKVLILCEIGCFFMGKFMDKISYKLTFSPVHCKPCLYNSLKIRYYPCCSTNRRKLFFFRMYSEKDSWYPLATRRSYSTFKIGYVFHR